MQNKMTENFLVISVTFEKIDLILYFQLGIEFLHKKSASKKFKHSLKL